MPSAVKAGRGWRGGWTVLAQGGPWSALAAVLLLGAAGAAGAPEPVAAGLAVVLAAGLGWRSALGGLCFLLFGAPFFLGEAYHHWFFVFGLMLLAWLPAAVLGLRRRGAAVDWGQLWPIVLLPLAGLVCLPLMIREIGWIVAAQPLRVSLEQMLLPSHSYPLFGLAHWLDLCLLAAAFPVMVTAIRQADQAQRRQAVAAVAWFVLLYCLAALLMFAWQPGGTWLGASLAGKVEGAISGFTFNRAYFGTWLVWSLPALAWPLWRGGRRGGAAVVALAALALALVCLGLNGQRSNLLALLAMLFVGLLLTPGLRWWARLALLLLPPAALLAMDLLWLDGFLWAKIVGFTPTNNPYSYIWQFAVGLWRLDPLLGVGTGSYAWWYAWPQDVLGAAANPHAFGNAHSLYLQLASEQGLLGLACLAFVFWRGFAGAVAAWRAEADGLARIALLGLTAAAVVAFNQSFLQIRAFALLWAVYLALAVVVGGEKGWRLSRRGWLALLLAAALLLGFRCWQIAQRPLKEDLRAGFYGLQTLADGRPSHRMQDWAVWVAPADLRGRRVYLDAAMLWPMPNNRPRNLEVLADGALMTRLFLSDNNWRRAWLSLPPGRGPLVLRLRAVPSGGVAEPAGVLPPELVVVLGRPGKAPR